MGLLNSSPCLTNQKWGFNMGLTNRGNILCVQFLQSFLSSTCQAAALSMAQAAHSWHSLEGEGLEESLSLTICTFNVLCERFEKKILKDGWQLEVENRNGTCLLTEGVCFKCNECSGINSLFPLCLILTYSCRAWQNGCCRFDPRRVVWIERLKHTSYCNCFPLKSWHIFESGDKLEAPSPFFRRHIRRMGRLRSGSGRSARTPWWQKSFAVRRTSCAYKKFLVLLKGTLWVALPILYHLIGYKTNHFWGDRVYVYVYTCTTPTIWYGVCLKTRYVIYTLHLKPPWMNTTLSLL